MTLPNHLAGGAVFTGIFAATISGVNLLASPFYIAVTLIASTLPDIDNTQSPIGRLCKPLSYWLNRRYGHRTITHSAVALLTISVIFAFCERALSGKTDHTWFFFWGYLSHIVLDMCTIQGVKLFYPFHKSSAVIPGDPRYRFETGNFRHETVFFCVSILCFFFLQPLFHQGFWTSYNRMFGTVKHVSSEFHKSEDMLEISYSYRIGTEHKEGRGYCLDASPNRILLLDNERFHEINETKVEVLKVLPKHTGMKFEFKDQVFVAINADSLNRLLALKRITKIEIHSNNQFESDNGVTPEIGINYISEYLDQLRIRPIDADYWKLRGNGNTKDTVIYHRSPRIATINRRISLMELEYQQQLSNYTTARRKIKELRVQGERVGEGNIGKYESIRGDIRELEKIKEPDDPSAEIEILRAEIREIQGEDSQRYSEKYRNWNQERNKEKPEVSEFTGFFKYVIVHEAPNSKVD
jgi:inner membrane protein